MNLSFQPPSSSFAPSFWEKLYELKLNQFKLDTSEKTIHARVKCSEGNKSKSIEFDGNSFQLSELKAIGRSFWTMTGLLVRVTVLVYMHI